VRDLKRVILHCSATPEGRKVSVDTIRGWHMDRGWDDIGYHFCILANGSIEKGRDIDKIGSHTYSHNADSIGICYIGGLDKEMHYKDTMTALQEIAFIQLVWSLRMILGPLKVHGHNEFSDKKCPSFKVNEKFKFLNEE